MSIDLVEELTYGRQAFSRMLLIIPWPEGKKLGEVSSETGDHAALYLAATESGVASACGDRPADTSWGLIITSSSA